jgi:hypothetical protein
MPSLSNRGGVWAQVAQIVLTIGETFSSASLADPRSDRKHALSFRFMRLPD